MRSAVRSLLFLSLLAGAAGWGFAARDARLDDLAGKIEAEDLRPLFENVTFTEWTKSVLKAMPQKERRHLADVLRKKSKSKIRESHLEQFRARWRSADEPDCDFFASFSMRTQPGDLSKPMIAFSSYPDAIPEMLAEAIKDNNMPLALSFYQPLSSATELLPRLSPEGRKNKEKFYRSLKLLEKREEERVYKGPYMNPSGLLVQDDFRLRQHLDGRWQAE